MSMKVNKDAPIAFEIQFNVEDDSRVWNVWLISIQKTLKDHRLIASFSLENTDKSYEHKGLFLFRVLFNIFGTTVQSRGKSRIKWKKNDKILLSSFKFINKSIFYLSLNIRLSVDDPDVDGFKIYCVIWHESC